MTDLRAALLRAHTEPAHDPETCTAHCFVVEALSAPVAKMGGVPCRTSDRLTVNDRADLPDDRADRVATVADALSDALDGYSDALRWANVIVDRLDALATPDRADPERRAEGLDRHEGRCSHDDPCHACLTSAALAVKREERHFDELSTLLHAARRLSDAIADQVAVGQDGLFPAAREFDVRTEYLAALKDLRTLLDAHPMVALTPPPAGNATETPDA